MPKVVTFFPPNRCNISLESTVGPIHGDANDDWQSGQYFRVDVVGVIRPSLLFRVLMFVFRFDRPRLHNFLQFNISGRRLL